MIEMQVFHDLTATIDKKEQSISKTTFSDEGGDPFHQNYLSSSLLSSDDQLHNLRKKAKSVDAKQALNINKKQYKLENQKFTKEYSQDFLDEFRDQNSNKQVFSSNKVYESDAQNIDTNERKISFEGYPVQENNQTVEDDDEFLFYNSQKRSMI